MDNHIFRSAALGFNRQDVMEYIEKVQKDAKTQIADLTAQLDKAQQESDAFRQELEDCTQERDQLRDELESLKERYKAEITVRDTVESESGQQKDRLQELEIENSLLTEQVRELESRMGDLRKEKERLTQLELDARRRSEELLAQTQVQADNVLAEAAARGSDIQAQAQAKSDAMLAEARCQITASVEKCEDLLRSYEIVADHVSSELRKMDVAVAQLPVGLNQLSQRLRELMDGGEEMSAQQVGN